MGVRVPREVPHRDQRSRRDERASSFNDPVAQMEVHETLNLRECGFESHLDHFAPLAQRLEPVFSNHQMRVRFLHGARRSDTYL